MTDRDLPVRMPLAGKVMSLVTSSVSFQWGAESPWRGWQGPEAAGAGRVAEKLLYTQTSIKGEFNELLHDLLCGSVNPV